MQRENQLPEWSLRAIVSQYPCSRVKGEASRRGHWPQDVNASWSGRISGYG